MNKKYLIYGLGALLVCLSVYVYFDRQRAAKVHFNKIEKNMVQEVDEGKDEEDSCGDESQYPEGNEGRKDAEDIKDSAAKPEVSRKYIVSDNELSEKKVIKEDIGTNTEVDIEKDGSYDIVEVFDTKLSPSFTANIQYKKYPIDFNYVVVSTTRGNIRKEPTSESSILKKVSRNEKINLDKAVKGQYIEKYDSGIWYKVYWEDKEERIYGYMFEKLGEARSFRINEMETFLKKIKVEIDSNKTGYISNYKNYRGAAPFYKGKAFDKYGERRYQAAPGYTAPDYKTEFRYIPDGALLSVLEEKDKFLKVRTLNFEGEYWVPKKYVSLKNSIGELKKVVVVDRKNQNQAVFEYSEDTWTLVSYTLATTGKRGRYSLKTPLGCYMVIEKRPSFLYYQDGTKIISGYAPHAIRFTGGMYLHGIPVNFKYIEGKRVNPGLRETSSTIGTIPLSHGCVRNNTSHAKFLYDWLDIGESVIIIIDELPAEEQIGY